MKNEKEDTNLSGNAENGLDKYYWDERYSSHQTGWDLGAPSPALVDFFENEDNKELRILIPGCGNAYEAKYLLESGFSDITLLDFAPTLVGILQQNFASFDEIQVIEADFFRFQGQFDLIIEQTFFCAQQKSQRTNYVAKMHELLVPGGQLIGLLFDREFEQGPPFGGSAEEYHKLFSEGNLEVLQMEKTALSVEPRMGTEVFFKVRKNKY
jgi:SAM-dependent methyltransferase